MTIQVRALGAYYLDEHVCALGLEAYRAAARSQQRSLAAVEQALYGARTALEQVGRRLGEDALKGYITEEHRRLKSLLEQARETRMHAATKLRQEIQVQARDIANRFAHDLERVDIVPLMRRHRGVSREGTAALQDLSVAVERWPTNVRLRSRRVALAMAVTGVQHRLISIVTRARNNVAEQLRSGVNADYGAMVDGLAAFKEAVSSAPYVLQEGPDGRFCAWAAGATE